MTRADSGRAIGAVTTLLQEHLTHLDFVVNVGRPETAAAGQGGPRLNIFLYEAHFDASLRSVTLAPDAEPPLWLALKYLVTAFDAKDLSDSAQAHELLGRGLAGLQSLTFLSLDDLQLSGALRSALERNPEPLKVTFDDASVDLVSKIMQGSEESYRFSMAFEVRPVMIETQALPAMARLVGVDSSSPPTIIGGDGVGVTVLPSLGPKLADVAPAAFEPGAEIAISGEELHVEGLACWLGPVQLSITARRPDRLTVLVEGDAQPPATIGPVEGGAAISAGEHPIVLRWPMANLRVRSSNMLVGRLTPVVSAAAVSAGVLTVDGVLLGRWEDDVLVALRKDGAIARMFEPGAAPPAPAQPRTVVPDVLQRTLTVAGLTDPVEGVTPGDYEVVVRVNGQQSRLNPTVTVA